MKNYVQHGDTLDMTAPAGGVVSGTAYLIGGLVGVAVKDAAEGETFPFRVTGVFTLPKAAAQAWSEGAVLYWDNTAKVFTTTSTDNTKAGAAVSAVLAAATLGAVRLNGVV